MTKPETMAALTLRERIEQSPVQWCCRECMVKHVTALVTDAIRATHWQVTTSYGDPDITYPETSRVVSEVLETMIGGAE